METMRILERYGEIWETDDQTEAHQIGAIRGAIMTMLIEDYLYGNAAEGGAI